MKVIALLLLIVFATFDVKFTFDHNTNRAANGEFKFKNVPSPAKDDAAAKARLMLVDGVLDGGSGDLSALTDGRLPADADEPGSNLYFSAGTTGGRFTMDFGTAIDIQQVNTYSWHPNSRGPQLYKLYASDGSAANFNPAPKRGVDPLDCGWTFVVTVNTIPAQGQDGGQYGVSITDARGSLGKHRYLLFDCYVTEFNDNWGNTFYSEVDVVGR